MIRPLAFAAAASAALSACAEPPPPPVDGEVVARAVALAHERAERVRAGKGEIDRLAAAR